MLYSAYYLSCWTAEFLSLQESHLNTLNRDPSCMDDLWMNFTHVFMCLASKYNIRWQDQGISHSGPLIISAVGKDSEKTGMKQFVQPEPSWMEYG